MIKRVMTAAAAALLLLAVSGCSKSDQTSKAADSTPSDTVTISAPDTTAQDSKSQNESSLTSGSEQTAEEATFDYQKDYSDSIIRRYMDVSRFSDKTKKYVIDPLCSDACSVKLTAKASIAPGLNTKISVTYAKDGDQRYIYTDLMPDSTYLKNSSGVYTLNFTDHTAKLTSSDSTSQESAVSPSSFIDNSAVNTLSAKLLPDFGQSPLTYVQSGAETYQQIPCTFAEYAVGKTSIKLYYEGNTLRFIRLQKDDLSAEVTFEYLKDSAEESFFTIPEGYTVSKGE